MNIPDRITHFINSQPEPKQSEMQELHNLMLRQMPDGRLWFDDGIGEDGRVITNPTIGYGFQTIQYAGGKTRDFFRIGVSANKTGISVYILGIKDKTYLARTYGDKLGKAKVTGYCIRFRSLKDIDIGVLEEAIRFGITYQ